MDYKVKNFDPCYKAITYFLPLCSVVWRVENLSSSAAWLALHAVTACWFYSQCFYHAWPAINKKEVNKIRDVEITAT